jgi:peptidoglycan/LPS O-acetylase OafA/YrhL
MDGVPTNSDLRPETSHASPAGAGNSKRVPGQPSATIVGASTHFLPRLEAMRGVAAMMVASGHCMEFFQNSKPVRLAVFFFMNGPAAVSLFFGLSGLVLGLGLRRTSGLSARSYATFALRRFLRIYPALLATLVFALLVVAAAHVPQSSPGAGRYFLMISEGYDSPAGWTKFLRNALLQETSLNNVLWTLRPEILCSVALPVLHVVSVRFGPLMRFTLVLALLALPIARVPIEPAFYYLWVFYLGYLVPDFAPLIAAKLHRLRAAEALYPLVVLGGCLMASFGRGGPIFSLIAQNTCAALFLGAVVYGRIPAGFRLLDTRVLKHLGQISYSFYLLHLPIAVLIGEQLFRKLPDSWLRGHPLAMSVTLWLVMTPITVILASWQYRWIEQPGIAVARAITSRLRQRG